jgi:hypothetical protein
MAMEQMEVSNEKGSNRWVKNERCSNTHGNNGEKTVKEKLLLSDS